MITSRKNPKIQRIRELQSRRKARAEEKAFVLEGVRLIEEAMHAGASPELVLFSQGSDRAEALVDLARKMGAEIEETETSLLAWASDTQSPQGILAVFPIRPMAIPKMMDFVLILDAISDPGNLGTILRTAAAAGVQLVLLSPETTDPYAPKVVRAGMGAHFHLPVHSMEWEQIAAAFQQNANPLQIFCSDVMAGKSCWEVDLRMPLALVIGNEATGASKEAQTMSHERIHIPMPGKIESLNASIAASILIFEVNRQRRS